MAMKSSLTSTRKTRSGCFTCKYRRVKCDEQRPSCLRCLSTQRICEGYVNPIQPSLTPDTLRDEERRAFLYFRSRTTHRIFGHQDANDWIPILLQMGHNEAPIKHALTAIASLHESQEPVDTSVSIRQSDKNARMTAQTLALKHYTAAIKSVQRESPTRPSRPDVVLALCILFICFEQFRTCDAACLIHLKAGLRLLYWWRSRTSLYTNLQEYSRPTMDFINNQITPLLQRLRVQFSLCMDSRHILMDLGVPLCLPTPTFPSSYPSFTSARIDFDKTMNYIFSFLESRRYKNTESSAESPNALLHQWKATLDASTFSEERPVLQKCTHNLLELYFHVSVVIIDTYHAQTETIFDQHTDRFQLIIDLAESIASMCVEKTEDFSLLFSFDLGITPPMFLVASRCRHPLIRRKAVALMLQSPFYHGVWQDRYSGLCAQRIMEIEEDGIEILMDHIMIPEDRRVRKISADLQEGECRITMQFVRSPFVTGAQTYTTSVSLAC
ncbi:hypothetical protein N7452_007020 [Penicillium brevicompactum]|uniref:Zn(2)-C6 fungal-type domain-containing protein n=1 Tax=Penicillium brevicompactum TaxID=5074 RepID=A0A9W9UED3_PENBR|nr:hypothetical protein N7452_007020 [Penicillium brevicompactum]